ncbi:MAG: BCD family MFS transporter, partial [Anaerolineales bacterium]
RIQLGLIHVAVTMTLVPINSTLNRVMIKELAIAATIVAILASLPYLISPMQVAIGSFADRNPIFGWRRTPYIIVGLIFCVLGVTLTPIAAFEIPQGTLPGWIFAVFAFGCWGLGYNFSTVSYLSLATELSGEKKRGGTIAVMWIMMIISIIITALVLSRLLDPYSPEILVRAFRLVGIAALLIGFLGLIKLEPRHLAEKVAGATRHSWGIMMKAVLSNRQATLFFIYMVLLLSALLGQDILLEPFAGQAFGMPVTITTRITSIWGVSTLITLAIAGMLERRFQKKIIAAWGGSVALAGFILIAFSGVIHDSTVFYIGVILLGLGTGLSTVSNLSLMLDMTTTNNIGLFIGAWGVASSASRLLGSMFAGVIRDVVTAVLQHPVLGYVVVFSLEAGFLLASLILLTRINVAAFREQASSTPVIERAAISGDI